MASRHLAIAPTRPASDRDAAPAPTVRDWVARASARLRAAGVPAEQAQADAAVLARHALGWDLATYLGHRDEAAPPAFAQTFAALVERRARHEPVAYLTGSREFWGLDFRVTPAVLVPRPETELVVEAAIAAFADRPHPVRIADAGTGSGCLAVALAHEFPAAHVVATDRSLDALRLARLNAGRHGVDGRVRFVLTDLLAGLRGPFDLVVANPPYVPEEDWPALPPEVRDYEPRQALEGGPGGLAVLARLVAQARPRLAPRGRLVVEIGAGQAGSARALLEGDGWHVAAVHHDLQGWPRVLVAARGARPGPERHGG